MTYQSRYANLNDAQKQAVDTIEGPVMVIAGPGTGKTELLSVRVATILHKTDTLPENILCLTFTDSGQAAMRERLVGIIGKDAYKVAIHTFHSFGSEVMSQNREYFYQNALFQPADELKQYEILRALFEALAHSNPLASMMNGEYTYLRDARSVISELKRRSALTSDELLEVLHQNQATLDVAEKILAPILSERVGKATGEKLHQASAELASFASTVTPLYQITPLAHVLSQSLETMLAETETIHPTKPITAWKNKWFERDEQKNIVCKDRKRVTKLAALSGIYADYLQRMEAAGLFDFDDMIMQVVHAVAAHDDLKYNLQEKYLYIMVDEFQDTNPAQQRILESLTDNPVNEGNPNILVVGDDDQAIYGFQGADSSNVLNFSKTYPARTLIVLTENYRSGAAVLEASRAVIEQAGDRLEKQIAELDKTLHAQPNKTATVEMWQAPNVEAEYLALAESISQSIKAGTDPSSIAVLARRHADLQALLPYLSSAGIPLRYEREESVLDSPPIVALEQVARVVVALAENRHDDAQQLLPKLLAHPAWQLEPQELWRLSLTAYTSRQNWMEIMATTPRFVAIHAWLTACAKDAATSLLEPMVDRLMGGAETPVPALQQSPYFNYFFSAYQLDTNPGEYLLYLSALRAVRGRLRDHLPGQLLTLRSFLDFIALHRQLGVTIMAHDYSAASDAPAVQLLTAHKSKGLEFDTVYVVQSIDNAWGASARAAARTISYPENLPLQSGGNTVDERLRLYYVAMTRARKALFLTFSEQNDGGKKTFIADFLVNAEVPRKEIHDTSTATALKAAELAWYEPLLVPVTELRDVLAPHIEKFTLSATSLNAFLDVSRGGPKAFLVNNLLHFPKTKIASASYGTAIHTTMQLAHTHILVAGEQKPLKESLKDFEIALTKERLDEKDFTFYLKKGSEELPAYLSSGVLPMTATQKAEVNFKYQQVVLNSAKLTGSLDMIDVNKAERTMVVTDYKTGKPSESWTHGDDHTKLKLHKYRQQLLFYKLLVEHSSEYARYHVSHGQLAFIQPTKGGKSIVLSLDLNNEDTERTERLISAVWNHIMALDMPDTSAYSPDSKGVLAFEQDLIDGIV
jgi:DNA helicase-2/ATP-dependent DNA helicase PcrA